MRVVLFLMVFLSAGYLRADNEVCDIFVNEGEIDCLWQQIEGNDKCPDEQSNMCQVGQPCVNQGLFGWCCLDAEGDWMLDTERGYEVLDTTSTAPKWSAPPPGKFGKTAMMSAVTCQKIYECTCELGPGGIQVCVSTRCGLAMLMTVTPNPDPMEICLPNP
jgi:hypothetical protein